MIALPPSWLGWRDRFCGFQRRRPDGYARLDVFGPEQGSSELQLDFEPIGARLVTRSPLDEASVDLCATSLGLDVNLHLSTASGALDERVQATLEATQAGFATLRALYLPLDSLRPAPTAVPAAPAAVSVGESR